LQGLVRQFEYGDEQDNGGSARNTQSDNSRTAKKPTAGQSRVNGGMLRQTKKDSRLIQ
jgi:hypothetical protein